MLVCFSFCGGAKRAGRLRLIPFRSSPVVQPQFYNFLKFIFTQSPVLRRISKTHIQDAYLRRISETHIQGAYQRRRYLRRTYLRAAAEIRPFKFKQKCSDIQITNKSSADSDSMNSALPQKSFPVINLSKFKLSGSSVSSQSSLTPFPDYSNLKFLSKQKPMPNLFQYNDRKKLVLSSDQQDQHQPSFYFQQKQEKTIAKEGFKIENVETVKKSKAGPCKEDDKENGNFQEVRQIKPQFANQKAEYQKTKIVEQQIQEKKQQIVLAKVYKIKAQEKSKNQAIKNPYIEDFHQDLVSAKASSQPPYQNTQKKPTHINKPEYNHQNHHYPTNLQNEHSHTKDQNVQWPITEQKAENIINAQLTIKKEQSMFQASKREMPIIEEQSNSKTQHILQRIQSDKHTIIAQSESERKLDSIRSYHQPQNGTPTKRKRNKIFDKSSIRRQPSHLASQRGLTPERVVKTTQKQQKSVQCEQQANRDLFPQIKAMNILDKLVDQIDHERVKPRNYNNAYQKQADCDIAGVIGFNKFLLAQIIALQNISSISELARQNYLERLKKLKESAEEMSQKIAKHQKSAFPHDAFAKFDRLNHLFSIIFTVCSRYKETVARLEQFQKKLEDFVIILTNKDSKRLYLLRRQLNVQLQLLYQLRAGCGQARHQKLFSDYLSNEIQLLKQIKEQIDGNFDNQLPILKF